MVRGALALLAAACVLCPSEALAFCRTTNCTCASATTCSTDCPTDSNGCPAKGDPVAWSGGCAGFSLDLQGTSVLSADQWTDAIVQAFGTWTTVDCGGGNPPSFDLLQLRDVACGKSEYNPNGPNVNVVYFTDDGWSGANIDGTLALTTVTFSDSGQILDADMAINSARNDFTVSDDNVQVDLVSIVTHEVGHFLGVAHSPYSSAVMYYSYAPGTIKRTLTSDDIAAVCTIYPPGQQKTCDPVPQGGLDSSCSAPSHGCDVTTSDRPSDGFGVIGFALAVVGLGTRGLVKRRGPR